MVKNQPGGGTWVAQSVKHPTLNFVFVFLRFYLFIHERQREREAQTQAEGEAGSMQGARCGPPSRDSRITPRAKAGTKPLSHPGIPYPYISKYVAYSC